MGLIMSGGMACAASCLASCAASVVGAGCSTLCCGTKNGSAASRAAFLLLFFIVSFATLLMRFFGGQSLGHLFYYDLKLCTTDACLGNQVVFRSSAALAVFFLLMALSQRSRSTAGLHSGVWALKIVLLGGLIGSTFLIPSSFFAGYADFARFVSIGFITIQDALVIEFAYTWMATWAERGNRWKVAILVSSLGIYIACIVAWIEFYSLFAAGDKCGTSEFFISFNIVFVVGYTLLSLSEKTAGGILPSAVVSMFCTYLLYGGLLRDPGTCNTVAPSAGSSNAGLMIAGLAMTAASLTWSAWRMSSSSAADALLSADDNDVIENGIDMLAPGEEEIAFDVDDENWRHFLFHIVLMTASIYMCMLLSDWATITPASLHMVNRSSQSMWANILSMWISSALYIWTLVAPMVFPEREFA